MVQNENNRLESGVCDLLHNKNCALVSDVLAREAEALSGLALNIPENTNVLIDKIIETTGKVVFTGLGKSWLVAQKLVGTFCSVGIPSVGLHGCDSLHGDLGVVQQNDIVIILSKSATGLEFEYLFSLLRAQKIYTVLICCNKGLLCGLADLVIQLPFKQEACALNLAPTSSTTITMAFGDALAIAISQAKGFTSADFARNHPAGALGRRLLLTVNALMHKGDSLPFIAPHATFSELMYTISSKKLGIGIVVDEFCVLKGIITDGDLRRACAQGPAVFDQCAGALMNMSPKSIDSRAMAINALEMMEQYGITSLVVVDGVIVVGVIHIHDLVKAGIKG